SPRGPTSKSAASAGSRFAPPRAGTSGGRPRRSSGLRARSPGSPDSARVVESLAMPATTVLLRGPVSVIDYRCTAGPADTPFVELHHGFSLSYVRNGGFGYRVRGEAFDLVTGSILVGHPGDEYVCTHEHVRGDECLSFHFAPEVVDAIGGRADAWRIGTAPPLPELMVLGELAQSA